MTYAGGNLIRDVRILDPQPEPTKPPAATVPEKPLPAEPLKTASPETAQEFGKRSWMRIGYHHKLTKGQEKWMEKLRNKDLSGFDTPVSSFVNLRRETLDHNPRATQDYRQKCAEICGLGG